MALASMFIYNVQLVQLDSRIIIFQVILHKNWCKVVQPHQDTDSGLVWCLLWHHVLIIYSLLLSPPPSSMLPFLSPTSLNSPSLPLSLSVYMSFSPSSNHGQKTGAEGREKRMWALHCSIDDPMIPWRTEPVRQTEWSSTQNQNQNQHCYHSI